MSIYPMISGRRRQASVLSPKDALLFLPLLGSAIALSFEVGSFIPVGVAAFGLFSLSEHLLFALQGLPLALVIAAMLGLLATLLSKVPNTLVGTLGKRRRFSGRITRRVLIGAAVVMFLVGAVMLYLGLFRDRQAVGVLIGVLIICLATVLAVSPQAFVVAPLEFLIAAGAFALMFAMAMGLDGTRYYLNLPEPRISRFIVDGIEKEAVIFRAGERGLLFYDPQDRHFGFAKWDTVKGFNWPRKSLVHPSIRPGAGS